MKNLFLVLAFVLLLTAGCGLTDERVRPSGPVTTELRSEADFSRIDVTDAFDVEIRNGLNSSVSIETNENVHDIVEVEVFSDELHVRLRDGFRLQNGSVVKVLIVAPTITEIIGSGAVEIELVDPLEQLALDFNLSGASSFHGEVRLDNLIGEARGASSINLTGRTTDYRLRARGASSIRDFDLVVDNLNLDLSGASSTRITVNETLSLEISGASSLVFMGDGEIISQSITGTSEVSRR
ncbi:MAG: head GIN domain-containing protein [Bacteroidota bacterium]